MLTHEKIVEVVRKAVNVFPLTKVSYFGSYAEGRATKDSDLDLLVEFDTADVSLLTIIGLKHEIEDMLGIPVDVIHAPIPKGALLTIEKEVVVYDRQG